MKAVNIIEELTKSSYNESDGVIHVDNNETILRAFEDVFGIAIDTVYAPYSMLNTGGEKGRNFLYIYTDRFPNRDADIFAIFIDENDQLIYLYEIE